MSVCRNCGTECSDDARFCASCGANMTAFTPQSGAQKQSPNPQTSAQQTAAPHASATQTPPPAAQVPPQPMYYPPYAPQVEKPVSIGTYLGTFFLLMIPVVGFILMIVWACGGHSNRSIVNFVRASLIYAVIVTVAAFLLMFLIYLLFSGSVSLSAFLRHPSLYY